MLKNTKEEDMVVVRNLINTLEEAQEIVSALNNAEWAEITQSGCRNYKVVDGELKMEGTDLFQFIVSTNANNVKDSEVVVNTYYDEYEDKILVFKDGHEEIWGQYPDTYWYKEDL